MNSIVIFLVTLSLLECSLAAKLPPNFKRCKIGDLPCLKDAIQDAIPKLKNGFSDLGVPSLDPLSVPKLSVSAGNIVQLVQDYQNVEFSGLSNSKVKDLSFDLNKGQLELYLEIPMAQMNANYSIKGKIMILDVHGSGGCQIKLEHIAGKITFDLEVYTKNNQEYLRGTKSNVVNQCGHATYQFDNLFDGNKAMGDNINKVVNDNWREIYDELGQGYMTAIGISLMSLMNKLFAKVPMEEIFLEA